MKRNEIRQANRKALPEMLPVAVIWAIDGGVPGILSAAATAARDTIG